ncbi:conserved hypothetical protein [Afipia carboxidovorans OM5]|uniref:Uncharacterized protein n=1 Tax=Afipia carboxidovorans (strain ATCC 49405 / DSM 1227 / KCTC 32145 / OM5) TaxID=504832 RepID=B6JD36_AFIC5|nr:methyltransferase domain-containing protein [Afipia carboxidovorans]ACI91766.1 conserved hypothetical protein [Afipia carboxidovorans OM5]AEI04368.1 hypothetical protein OCA4_c32710 [Afipia carboxidovorans OM4]AEI07998.1 hypothetical protein OCA5_c33230 [Afipia carboxidovorans OM5]
MNLLKPFRRLKKRSKPAGIDRKAELLRHITKDLEGIEIGPYFNPLVPKAEGFRSFNIDVFDTEHLREMGASDPAVRDHVARIEEVDLVGPAQDIARLVQEKFGDKKFDYVVSSHNLEHIPDPIRFIMGCRAILKDGGFLSLAVPDHRCCFDYFLPVSTLPDWLEAYFEKRSKPTAKQVFLRTYARAEQRKSSGKTYSSFNIDTDAGQIFAIEDELAPGFDLWRDLNERRDHEYIDAHCWFFTPESFKLICLDLQKLGLLPFVVDSVRGPNGNEFYAHLRASDPVVSAGFEETRLNLLRTVAAQ